MLNRDKDEETLIKFIEEIKDIAKKRRLSIHKEASGTPYYPLSYRHEPCKLIDYSSYTVKDRKQ